MKRKTLEKVVEIIPDFLTNAVDYLKNNFDENGQEILGKASGTTIAVIKLFTQPLINKYFENITEKKLENFGLQTYIKSAILQATKSIELIEDKLDKEYSPSIIVGIINRSMFEEIESFDKNDAILVFQPQYHPAVEYVKRSYERMLRELGANQTDINTFLKNYNENIEATIIKEFGDDYDKHLEKTKDFRLKDNEVKFLFDTIQQGRIGFKPNENLKYETTYAQWQHVSSLRESENENAEEYEKQEQALKPINELIEEYFDINRDNHINKILFTVADFGKGKSVFMRNYAAELAKKYLETFDGDFPVYFNLRNFSKYSSEAHLGVISDFLLTEYGIKIDEDYFKKKRFIFLIDSLDESGELNKAAIDKVINSVKNIQNIDKTICRTNRIIISSRPFDEGLRQQLDIYDPYKIKKTEGGKEIEYACYLNIYGFTKVQFNDWLRQTLKSDNEFENIATNGFAKEIIDAIKANSDIDIYEKLLKNGTLSRSELRRPIFSYMIYQLIIHNVDFMEIGKLGVYLSFLNLLTKEAKHIDDPNYQVNLIEELEFRNILHATTALWAYERQKGKQGMLKKADICHVLEGKNNSNESDNEVLERNKNITEIQFLSHSYFGENDNVLHFQHQSFAEILLAEYYLKIFIKYALDENADIDEARAKLVAGEPTEQTIFFLKELLELLKETSADSTTPQIIEKRRLLFPLMASLSISKHNKRLFCSLIAHKWFQLYEFKENETEYPKALLEKWCIGQNEIDSILTFAAKILNNTKTIYQAGRATPKKALFDFEVVEIPVNQKTTNYDKWLSLLVGNHLYNDVEDKEQPKLFNWDHKINPTQLFDMIRSWNYSFNDSSPSWGRNLFRGINMEDYNGSNLHHSNFEGIDFSFSTISNFWSWGANWCRTKLDYCCFRDVRFTHSLFIDASIQNIKELEKFKMRNCQATSSGFTLLNGLDTYNLEDNNIYFEKDKPRAFISSYDIDVMFYSNVFGTCSGFMIYGLKQSFFTIKELKSCFTFDNDETKKVFLEKIDSLKEYEVKSEKKKND
ncbi:MAG: NACHT domain-containing protein [Dysgonamonadaceae bacterium]|nr:NACHT domain-containing protein [Dysgonamonadaceae bacterium]